MIGRLAAIAVVGAGLGAAAFWFLTTPVVIEAAELPDHAADLENGARMFHAGGCSSCHAAPGAKGDDKLKLGGGLELKTDFGIFRVPNISPDPETGIGRWSPVDFVNAVMHGVSPQGEHLYPSFPYASYSRMKVEDVLDLKAFLDTLPKVSHRVAGHDLPFPFSIRRGVGLWKLLYLDPAPVVRFAQPDGEVARGQYLVEGPGHCGECHTPRDFAGGLILSKWLEGAPNPDGKGVIPGITPASKEVGDWTGDDIVYALETGFTPSYDSFGGSMVEVQENLAQLPKADLEAIAAYLKALPGEGANTR
ncbi:Nicotinate dehydrogenase subunit B [Hartmannibacter diazotrophicus]|uniref:Nicotinate dehydrogenase subunit B n=1 Tax=Hartmannibacter diazotrophicus TaxID=1482074 RepID=A0A2C9D3Z0_9HYPH|nr:cytochrome c [Hartmannibacter diazotrophicus]SON54899.1 Nicotinate dehydrogenase subunit B [Hartmannibacter diazotrophicus]